MSRPDEAGQQALAAEALRTALEILEQARLQAALWVDVVRQQAESRTGAQFPAPAVMADEAYDAALGRYGVIRRLAGALRDEVETHAESAPESPAAGLPGVTTPADPVQAAHGDAGGRESGSGANDTRVVRVELPGPRGWVTDNWEWSDSQPAPAHGEYWGPCWKLDALTHGGYVTAFPAAVDLGGTVHDDLDALAEEAARILAAIQHAKREQQARRGGES